MNSYHPDSCSLFLSALTWRRLLNGSLRVGGMDECVRPYTTVFLHAWGGGRITSAVQVDVDDCKKICSVCCSCDGLSRARGERTERACGFHRFDSRGAGVRPEAVRNHAAITFSNQFRD